MKYVDIMENHNKKCEWFLVNIALAAPEVRLYCWHWGAIEVYL